MKKALDIFSKQASTYKKYRPSYPAALYDEIFQYVNNMDTCWDCATGNGQVAQKLSKHFSMVYASDLSQEQLDEAEKKDNIIYKVERAERTSFEADQFDLITVAQAMHWFDMDAFNKEVYRVARNGGIIAVWGYGLLRINSAIDMILDEFCYKTLGPYWNAERIHIDKGYETIHFGFEEINQNRDRSMTANWSLQQLEGYLNSWSSLQNYKEQKAKNNPVPDIIKRIQPHWGSTSLRPVKFPIYLKVGRVQK